MDNRTGRWQMLGRLGGASLLFATGAIHLDLYITGYRTVPTIGWLFLLQVIAALGLGASVLVVRSRLFAAVGALFALSTLGGYLLSVWIGLFHFKEVRTTAGIVAGVLEVAAFATLAALALVPQDSDATPRWRRPVGHVLPGALWRSGVVAAATVVVAALLGIVLATAGSAAASPTGGRAELTETRIGGETVLTNARGFTLYYFAPDTPTTSRCYGACAVYWPPVTGNPVAGPGVTGKIGTIMRKNGAHQVTYDGHPLYGYIGDSSPGQARGNDIDLNGGYWYDIAVSSGTSKSAVTTSQTRASNDHGFVTSLGTPAQIGSTVPANGDLNPYGISVVPRETGRLVKGDFLVSNFNDKANVQGTGTTLVELSPGGKQRQFAKLSSLPAGDRCPGGVGLATGLAILPGGWVVVGSVPAAGPSGAPANTNPVGCLIVLNSSGRVTETWSDHDINGPWDLVSSVHGKRADLFVSNVFSRPAGDRRLPKTGLCTVARLEIHLGSGLPCLLSSTVVGKGFPWQANNPTFVLGPTGLALGPSGTLYAAQTLGNNITAIPHALTRDSAVGYGSSTLTSGGLLDAPLGMVLAPNGDLLVTNGNDGNLVETTPKGRQLAKDTLIKAGAGDLFGITLSATHNGIVFVDDGTNSIEMVSEGGH